VEWVEMALAAAAAVHLLMARQLMDLGVLAELAELGAAAAAGVPGDLEESEEPEDMAAAAVDLRSISLQRRQEQVLGLEEAARAASMEAAEAQIALDSGAQEEILLQVR
jgi:hypothetical protein